MCEPKATGGRRVERRAGEDGAAKQFDERSRTNRDHARLERRCCEAGTKRKSNASYLSALSRPKREKSREVWGAKDSESWLERAQRKGKEGQAISLILGCDGGRGAAAGHQRARPEATKQSETSQPSERPERPTQSVRDERTKERPPMVSERGLARMVRRSSLMSEAARTETMPDNQRSICR